MALLATVVVTLFTAHPAQAATPAQTTAQRATAVAGFLDPASYHYLGMEPTLRDGTIVLTIALEPADDTDLRGAINFIVLTDDGLRRVLAGADPVDLDIAASAPLQFDPIGNKFQAMFKASGSGHYTVVVYNTGGKTGGYTLTALNGVLLDDADQIRVIAAAPVPYTPPTLSASSTPTETMAAMVSASQGSPLAAGTAMGPLTQGAPVVNALRLSGALDPVLSRHFLSVKPSVRDGIVDLDMVYEPRGLQTDGKVNFWVIDEDGMRRFVYGADPEAVQIATGFQKPFSPDINELVASIQASGSNEYTLVPYSVAPITVTYVIKVDGGLVIDRYGQTNESTAALAEYAALANAGVTSAPVTPTTAITPAATAPSLQLTIPGTTSFTLVSAPAAGAEDPTAASRQQAAGPLQLTQVSGELPTPYAHNYWSLYPTIRDGIVVLTMDYDPRDQEALLGHINFWVVDEDGMRRIVDGARPEDFALAGGSVVPFGEDKGKLQGAFRASGKGQYAVIIHNDSVVPATYTLSATGGIILAPANDSQLVQALP